MYVFKIEECGFMVYGIAFTQTTFQLHVKKVNEELHYSNTLRNLFLPY